MTQIGVTYEYNLLGHTILNHTAKSWHARLEALWSRFEIMLDQINDHKPNMTTMGVRPCYYHTHFFMSLHEKYLNYALIK